MIEVKKGFSLVEMLMVMMIFSVFVAAGAPILTKKYFKNSSVAHGRYECFKNAAGDVYEIKTVGTSSQAPALAPGGICTFVPDKRAAYFKVTLVGGGGSGASNPVVGGGGGRAGQFVSLFVPTLDATTVANNMHIGNGGTAPGANSKGNGGEATTLGDISAAGGLGGMYTQTDYLQATTTCTITAPGNCTYFPAGKYFSLDTTAVVKQPPIAEFTYVSSAPYTYQSSAAYGNILVYPVFSIGNPYTLATGESCAQFAAFAQSSDFAPAVPTAGSGGNGGAAPTAGSSGEIIVIW